DLLDRDSLVRILTEPKNALTRQYQELFSVDGIELKFDEDALKAIADRAVVRKTGARGLRAILEDVMKNIMFELPSEEDIASCTITKEMVENGAAPILTLKNGQQKLSGTA
ncbi:MAG: ATP-dependent Clp protease ATP-binding subunit ClpX, partial [Clostridia bacterium]|nr:ATP-dependent Clp protease ATP-binding subunit ClpX [Clostridia bacterium]